MKKIITIAVILFWAVAQSQTDLPLIKVSANQRYFETTDDKPFFWLGDTGWLLFVKCNNEEAVQYLETRKQQGFNVVQVMVLHALNDTNVYGDSALVNKNIAQPQMTDGAQNNYWNHIDFVIQEAAKRGIYMAMVPIWGGNVKAGKVTTQQAAAYAKFLAGRYSKYNNIIWMNGGDIPGSEKIEVWKTIGATLRQYDTRHLITFHPRGRTSSSVWFHKEAWLDFNMFQSGHKDYAQDTSSNETNHYGEDNWKFVKADYKLLPVKPTMDGEPSYENIPHGLHDSLQARWTAADVRRYAYWSVFAGGAGFTYGENAVMQFHTMGAARGSFGVNQNWKETIHSPAAEQMKYLKTLMLSKPYFGRMPAQEIITDNTKDKYNYILATKGKGYAMAYTFTGRNFTVDLDKVSFKVTKAEWFNPRSGATIAIDNVRESGAVEFNPPGEPADGNDWVLVLE
ncbi:MAG: glycoside hydrolase family 140 protein [Bacteroidota bacterium]